MAIVNYNFTVMNKYHKIMKYFISNMQMKNKFDKYNNGLTFQIKNVKVYKNISFNNLTDYFKIMKLHV